jgi:3-methyladenine DNA glycosylase AlkD
MAGSPEPSGEATLSVATAAAEAFVRDRRADAMDLGRQLADDLDDPNAFVRGAEIGLARLGDPAFVAAIHLVAPGIGPVAGVRGPLLHAVERTLLRELKGVRASRLLPLAEASARSSIREVRWLAITLAGRAVRDEPEMAWQVLRRIGREADDWITVDTLGNILAPAILREPYRWAELEQLVFSPIRWERRLVGSTVASMALARSSEVRGPEAVRHALDLLAMLMGDAEPDVQKSLSWALRNLARADLEAVTGFCLVEAETAARASDGNRAWVLRDASPKLRPDDAARVRSLLEGLRRVAGGPSTSRAAEVASAFVGAGLGAPARNHLT